ncbi:MAG: RNA-binding protein [Candidatus Cloacimonetes bacterium]|nr:RNA-binding protein [Candidatus Cloacimonadota bacterium]
MRVDQLLKRLYLIRTRTLAKKACDNDLVIINARKAKASSEVHAGDIIEFSFFNIHKKIRILKLPWGNISRNRVSEYYQLLAAGDTVEK